MAQDPAAKTNSPAEIVLAELNHFAQLIVETCNSTYVFLWSSLHSARLIQCTNQYIDLGNVQLLGSYPRTPDLTATGRLKIGESMLYIIHPSPTNPAAEITAVWTSPICKLRHHQQAIKPAHLQPGLLNPQSYPSQSQLEAHKPPLDQQKFEGSPVLWTPTAPKIPKSLILPALVLPN